MKDQRIEVTMPCGHILAVIIQPTPNQGIRTVDARTCSMCDIMAGVRGTTPREVDPGLAKHGATPDSRLP